ncbi:unnamed protein product [Sphagnum jensenii]|uniref:Uncharacterized protein n=1 Tax=Sphagnum jensenii TaxID=128206 RepID=A0ABP1C1H4_9BRYO
MPTLEVQEELKVEVNHLWKASKDADTYPSWCLNLSGAMRGSRVMEVLEQSALSTLVLVHQILKLFFSYMFSEYNSWFES